ncbi:hypothetical protein [Sphingomonas sp.]|uniref:hypothetical protein n=1 Tax=Sphingomonas sp. TaxID=28214 RepID=UPI003B3A8184
MEEKVVAPRPGRSIQVCFFFNAQRHQLLHGIATAAALARTPGFDVHVVSPSQAHIDYARQAVDRLGGAPVSFVHARSSLLAAGMRRTGSVVPPKVMSLALLAPWLKRFDAIALPERTSILLKRMGVRHPSFIHLDHGAGDRAAGFDPRIRHFDFVLMAGPKHRERMMAERLIRPGAHAVVGYPKFEAADAVRDPDWRPFADARPVVLYNPHFCTLGSWQPCIEQVLAAFAGQDRYNLILAPHVRLLDGDAARTRWGALLDRYEGHPRIHIDRGSDRAIDMTYTTLADLYLGDVSSQVYEYLRTPRPCLFLNPHKVDWRDDENYAHWHFGPVAESADGLIDAVDRAIADHPRWRAAQAEGVARTFLPGGGAAMAASAIAGHLAHRTHAAPVAPRPRRRWARASRGVVVPARRAAMILPLVFAGWMLNETITPSFSRAAGSSFVDDAVAAHRVTLLRQDMASQRESDRYDPAEIRRATGIAMPALPAGWTVGDSQLYPSSGGDIVQLFLRTPAGDRVSLVGMRVETNADAQPVLANRAAERIAYWENGEFAYALVGTLPPARLLTLASAVARD